ncbi:MAG: hypothetical protein QXZ44_00105 [Ferroplasma sp.]
MVSHKYAKRSKRYTDRVNKNYRENNGVKTVKKLDMKREEEFNYMLGSILKELPDSVRGSVRGSIYSLMSKIGVKDAKDYIVKKNEEGVIDEHMEKDLLDLISHYTRYRN